MFTPTAPATARNLRRNSGRRQEPLAAGIRLRDVVIDTEKIGEALGRVGTRGDHVRFQVAGNLDGFRPVPVESKRTATVLAVEVHRTFGSRALRVQLVQRGAGFVSGFGCRIASGRGAPGLIRSRDDT